MERLTRYTCSATPAGAHPLSVLYRAGLRDLSDVLVPVERVVRVVYNFLDDLDRRSR